MTKIKRALVVAAETAGLVAIVMCSVFPFSCRISQEGIQVIGGDYASPVLENMTVINDSTLQMSFSESVTLSNVVVSPVIEGISNSDKHSRTENLSQALAAASGANGKLNVNIDRSEDGKRFTFHFEQNTQVGKAYEVFGTVHDNIGNSLTFCAPFTGYNNRIPQLIMTEAQIKYTKAVLKTGTAWRSEFIEFLALTDGNLAGIEFVSASDGESKVYCMPPVEVTRGQIFVVHLRTAGEGCIDESGAGENTTADFNAAFAEFSTAGIMDLWSDNTTARLNDTADVLIVRNSVDGSIMDALMYATDDLTEWKPAVEEYAYLVEQAGIYDSEDISNSCSSSGTSPKKSLQRCAAAEIYETVVSGGEVDYPVSVTPDSWVVGEATPGRL